MQEVEERGGEAGGGGVGAGDDEQAALAHELAVGEERASAARVAGAQEVVEDVGAVGGGADGLAGGALRGAEFLVAAQAGEEFLEEQLVDAEREQRLHVAHLTHVSGGWRRGGGTYGVEAAGAVRDDVEDVAVLGLVEHLEVVPEADLAHHVKGEVSGQLRNVLRRGGAGGALAQQGAEAADDGEDGVLHAVQRAVRQGLAQHPALGAVVEGLRVDDGLRAPAGEELGEDAKVRRLGHVGLGAVDGVQRRRRVDGDPVGPIAHHIPYLSLAQTLTVRLYVP